MEITPEQKAVIGQAVRARFEARFPLVEVSKLSLTDEFLKYKPEYDDEERLKKSIMYGIKFEIPDFRRPCIDPSFGSNGSIVFRPGNLPASGKTTRWWDENAKNFWPRKKSRLGKQQEYDLFLGVLMNELVWRGYSVDYVWWYVCRNSSCLGHYSNSAGAKEYYEPTGSRRIGAFYDLANTAKVIRKDEVDGFLRVGGFFNSHGAVSPLACARTIKEPNLDKGGVGWIVMDP